MRKSKTLDQLINYIKSNLKKGYTLDSLKYSLINQGYTRISVENAIDFANKELAKKIPPIKEKPQITYKLINDESGEAILVTPRKKSFWKKIFG